MPTMVIIVEAARVDNAIHFDYLTSEVALVEPEIGRTDPKIPIDNNCTNNELHFGMAGGSGDYEDDCCKSDKGDAIPTGSQGRRPTNQHERFDLGNGDVDGYEGNDANDADADEVKEALVADDASTQNVEDWGRSSRECEDWTVYFRPAKYNNSEANATASDVFEAKTVL